MSAAKPHKKSKHRNVATKGVVREGGGDDNGGEGKSKGGCFRPLWIVLAWFFGIVLMVFLGLKIVTWMDDIRFRMMDEKDVPVRFEKLRDNGQIMDAYKLLLVRPDEETPQIVGMLMDKVDTLEAPFLFVIAERMYAEKPDEALFWAMAGRMRLEYDINRCADARAVQDIYKLFLMALMSDELFEAATDEDLTRPLVQRVLDWDAEHPPGYWPGYICMILTRNPQVVGEARWPAIRYRLRKAAENYLRETADDPALQAPETPDPDVPGVTDAPEETPENAAPEEAPEDKPEGPEDGDGAE